MLFVYPYTSTTIHSKIKLNYQTTVEINKILSIDINLYQPFEDYLYCQSFKHRQYLNGQ